MKPVHLNIQVVSYRLAFHRIQLNKLLNTEMKIPFTPVPNKMAFLSCWCSVLPSK